MNQNQRQKLAITITSLLRNPADADMLIRRIEGATLGSVIDQIQAALGQWPKNTVDQVLFVAKVQVLGQMAAELSASIASSDQVPAVFQEHFDQGRRISQRLAQEVQQSHATLEQLRALFGQMGCVVDRIPKTADGNPILLGDTVYFANDDPEYWGTEPVLFTQVKAISLGLSFRNYKGIKTVTGEKWEGGNLDCYANPQNVPKNGMK